MRRRFLAIISLAISIFMIDARPAQAQWGWTFYSVGEFDTNDVVFALAGISIAPQRMGWVPVAGIQAYWLRFPIGTSDQSVISVLPSVGLGRNFDGGAFQVRVGYNFSNEDIRAANVTADVGDGVVNTAQLDYWGTGGLGAQGIMSYNYGSESLWARGRVTTRLTDYGSAGQIRIGGEVAYLDGNGFSSVQPGVIVGFHPSAGTIINAGVGKRFNDGEDATYFKVELVLTPGR
ncbi:MAG: hypothetical protein WEE89_00075 [Gemmatimonadota bacterium]